MGKIEKLTEAQEAKLAEYREKGLALGLRTTPLDRNKAEAAVSTLYVAAGRKAPRIVWCQSPFSAHLTMHILKNTKGCPPTGASVRASVWASVGASVWDSVWASVRDSVRASVWDSVGASVRDSVGASVWDSVGDSVWASVRDSVGASVWDSVGASVRDSVGASVGDSVGASVWASVWDSKIEYHAALLGDPEAGWWAWYSYYKHVLKLDLKTDSAKETAWVQFVETCHWAYLFEHTVFLVDSPSEIHLQDGQVHNELGACVKYRDGWGIHAINGHRVPAFVVEAPETITLKHIEDEGNAETRRIMIDRYGVGRYLVDSGAELLDSDNLGLEGSGIRCLSKDKKGQHWLTGTDGSTARVYSMPVPESKTCKEAHNFISGGIESALICEA